MHRVIKRFNDRITHERYEVGDTYSGDRVDELVRKGFVEQAQPRGPLGRFRSTTKPGPAWSDEGDGSIEGGDEDGHS